MMSLNRKLSVGGAVGIGIGLAGYGIQMWFPEKRWLGKWFIATGLIVVVVALIAYVVRWLTIRELENDRPRRESDSAQFLSQAEARQGEININVGTIRQSAENANLIQENLRKSAFSEPHIEFTNPDMKPRWLDNLARLTDERPKHQSEPFSLLLARFYYKPERDVPPRMMVKAHISIANSKGVPVKARYDGVWDGEDTSEVWFSTADTHALVVALLPVEEKVNGIMTWGFGRNRHRNFAPDNVPLDGKEFRLRIEIVGEHESDVVFHLPLDFRLKIHPHQLELL